MLYLSLHKLAGHFFPGTGEASEVGNGRGTGFTVNVPWRHEGMGDAEYAAAFEALVMPIATQFDPQLVIVSAGFDAASGDKVGGMCVTPDGFGRMTRDLTRLAGGRAVYALEGGYKPATVARCVAACVRVLLQSAGAPAKATALSISAPPDADPDSEPTSPRPKLAKGAIHALSEAVRVHAVHWPVLHDTIARVVLRSPRPSRTSERPSGERFSERASERGSERGSERCSERQSERQSERTSGAPSDFDADDDLSGEQSDSLSTSLPASPALRPGTSPRASPRAKQPRSPSASPSCLAGGSGSGSPSKHSQGSLGVTFELPEAAVAPSTSHHGNRGTGGAGSAGVGVGAGAMHACCACVRLLPRSCFAESQMRRKKAGERKCKECVADRPEAAVDPSAHAADAVDVSTSSSPGAASGGAEGGGGLLSTVTSVVRGVASSTRSYILGSDSPPPTLPGGAPASPTKAGTTRELEVAADGLCILAPSSSSASPTARSIVPTPASSTSSGAAPRSEWRWGKQGSTANDNQSQLS